VGEFTRWQGEESSVRGRSERIRASTDDVTCRATCFHKALQIDRISSANLDFPFPW
jgi:hypothetical protein